MTNVIATVQWYCRTARQELLKFKFYPLMRYIYDADFRRDIQKLHRLLRGGRLPIRTTKIRLCDVHFSHDINYPKWVEKLEKDILSGKPLPPIKIIWDGHCYRVIDGNHRLAAMKNICQKGSVIKIIARELIKPNSPHRDTYEI